MDVAPFRERFCCREIVGEKERNSFYKLRYQEYVIKYGWESPNSIGMEMDYFDQFSYHFGCFDKESDLLIAGARLIDARKTSLFFEKYILTTILRNGLEISRFIVRKEEIKRNDRCYARAELFYALQKFAEQKNYDYMYAFIATRYFEALKRTGGGFFEAISEKINFKNGLYLPVKAQVSAIKEYFLTNQIWQSYFFKST